MTRAILLAAAAALSLSACAPTTADQGTAEKTAVGTPDMTPETASSFVPMAASGDSFEINSSRLALERSTNNGVRTYAQMMIRDHTNTTQQLSAAARAAGITPPPPGTMLPLHQTMFDRLQGAGSGASFDRAYWREQVMSHQTSLALHSNYATDGDTPALRQVASAATPIVRMHLEQAQQMNR